MIEYSALKKTSLFSGIDESEIEAMLGCLGARIKSYQKNGYVLRIGDSPDCVGLIISGSVLVIQEDFWEKEIFAPA